MEFQEANKSEYLRVLGEITQTMFDATRDMDPKDIFLGGDPAKGLTAEGEEIFKELMYKKFPETRPMPSYLEDHPKRAFWTRPKEN